MFRQAIDEVFIAIDEVFCETWERFKIMLRKGPWV